MSRQGNCLDNAPAEMLHDFVSTKSKKDQFQ